MNKESRLSVCHIGVGFLKVFMVTTLVSVVALLIGFFGVYPDRGNLLQEPKHWLLTSLVVILSESVVFWVGILLVYLTCNQLGLRHRVWGLVLGLVPIANIVMLVKIIKLADGEITFERKKMETNKLRKEQEVCKTRYPILLVHGVFFRDFEHLNYWGRIPEELIANGATVFYGNHNSAAAVRDSAVELEKRIREIVEQTGCEKVNIIAHSKGGLDSRCAISLQGMAPYVASLTTINTPHRGCEFADYLLHHIPEAQKEAVARTYNTAAAKLGDVNPDFLAAVYDLTKENCASFNEEVKDMPGIFYQSFGSKQNKGGSGRFPLNLTYNFVRLFDGANDGLVGEKSFPWGEGYHFLTVKGTRGISHGDMIDLNRENIPEFDVRELYVQIVSNLKKRGL